MKELVDGVLDKVSGFYRYLLVPPSIEGTRQRRRLALRMKNTDNGPTRAIRKKKRIRRRRGPMVQEAPSEVQSGWAMSRNDNKGIFFATKVSEENEEEALMKEDTPASPASSPVKDPASPVSQSTPGDGEQTRINQLEAELAELKKSLAAFSGGASAPSTSAPNPTSMPPPPPSAFQNLPPPPPSIALRAPPVRVPSVPSDNSMLTPCIHSPGGPGRLPAPNFDQMDSPASPPPPPPLPSLEEMQAGPKPARLMDASALAHVVPSGLHRTQSLTDMIASGKAHKSTLRRTSTARSPGGTPLRHRNGNNDSFLAQAIRKKFQVCPSPLVSDFSPS